VKTKEKVKSFVEIGIFFGDPKAAVWVRMRVIRTYCKEGVHVDGVGQEFGANVQRRPQKSLCWMPLTGGDIESPRRP
jgi:hypothetical protein